MFKRVLAVAGYAAWLAAISTAQTNTFPSSGNVGIGTTSPQAPLHINSSKGLMVGNPSYNYSFGATDEAIFAGNLTLQNMANANWIGIQFKGANLPVSGSMFVGFNPSVASGELQFVNASGQPVAAIEQNGNFGIGTTNPTQALSVNGNISATSGTGGGGLYFRTAGSQQNTVVSQALLMEGALSGNASTATPWGLNLVSTPWSWGEDPITYHGGFHDFRTIGGNAAEKDVLNINGGGIVFLPGSGTSIIFADSTQQSTAWTGVLCGGDYAESVGVSDDRTHYEPGDLIVVDSDSPGKFLKSAEPYSTLVAGIYSTKPGVVGRRTTDAAVAKDEIPMAMIGIVPAKVSAENGPVKAGDLLVASSTPGYAMKGTDHERMIGAVVGKALGVLQAGTGVINVLVTLQ